jgi:hypothetical protein
LILIGVAQPRPKAARVRFVFLDDASAARFHSPACVADSRQHHALAAPVQGCNAVRRVDRSSPLRIDHRGRASPRRDALMFNPSGGIRSRQGVVLPVFNQEKTMSLALASAPLSAEQARAESIGYLALACVGKRLPLQVLCSAAGHYIGTADADGPVSRESVELLPLAPRRRARPLETGRWQQRLHP